MAAKFSYRLWFLIGIIFSLFIVFCPNQSFQQQQTKKTPTKLVTDQYYGSPLGPLLGGPAKGTVFAADERTLFIKGFSLPTGTHPLAFFQGGSTLFPDGTGFLISDENKSLLPLKDYQNKDLVIRLPEGQTLRDIRWFSVWDRSLHTSLGHVLIPVGVELPRSVDLPPLTSLAHNVRSGPLTIVDAQTIMIRNFWYDGLAPAAYWWATKGQRQSPQGLRLKNEKNSVQPLRAYHGETFSLKLPDEKTIYDFDWLGVWCEQFQVDFGNVKIPHHLRVPPSSKMLGLKPESKINCEVLDIGRSFEMRWILDGDDVVMQLLAKIQPHEYMAVGWNKDDSQSTMIGADAVVAWIDSQGNGHAEDYFLSSKEQCVGARGSCPDLKYPGATDGVMLLHAAVVNGYRVVTLKRPQIALDELYDQHIFSDGRQSILWALGPLNHLNEVSYHTSHSYGNRFVNFARKPSQWNCPGPTSVWKKNKRDQQHQLRSLEASLNDSTLSTLESILLNDQIGFFNSMDNTSTTTSQPINATVSSNKSNEQTTNSDDEVKPWKISKIVCPHDGRIWAQIGPTGGERGYRGITGRQGWGIAWYINGLLIPEIVLKRGVEYTFYVEGGNNPENGARRHPLYLTDSAEGGIEYKSLEERSLEKVFAGVETLPNGTIVPTAEGRLCEWKLSPSTKINEIDLFYPQFEQFQRTLSLKCDQNGHAGSFQFKPNNSTPDLLYYQCFTHRYLGWKIHIVDHCPKK